MPLLETTVRQLDEAIGRRAQPKLEAPAGRQLARARRKFSELVRGDPAAAAWPLVLQQEPLLIRPTPQSPAELEALLQQAKETEAVLALLKLGARWSWVRLLLEKRGLLEASLFARRVGWSDQLLCPGEQVPAEDAPYFSLLLIRQGWPPVLP